MPLLMLFALIAGAGTAITPCVLPCCRRCCRPARSAAAGARSASCVGLAVTFTIAIVALAQLVKGVGLASGAAGRWRSSCCSASARACSCPDARGPRPGAAVAAGPVRPADARDRLLVRRRRRRRARLRVRPVRGPDPRRGHLGQRLGRRLGPGRRRGDRLLGRALGRAAALRARRPRGARPDPALGPRPRRRAGARSGPARSPRW